MKPTKEQIEVGNKIAKDLHEVSTKKALNPDEINIEDIDIFWRDLVVDYMNNEIDSVEAIWTAMNRVEEVNHLDGLNLNVTHYRNGDPIRLAQSEEDWIDAGRNKEGAYCIAEETGGHLYNWYAVDDSRGLAPEGYKIPTDDESYSIIRDIHPDQNEWHGFRDEEGNFCDQGEYAPFWTTTEENKPTAFLYCIYITEHGTFRYISNYDKSNGVSVLCIKE